MAKKVANNYVAEMILGFCSYVVAVNENLVRIRTLKLHYAQLIKNIYTKIMSAGWQLPVTVSSHGSKCDLCEISFPAS